MQGYYFLMAFTQFCRVSSKRLHVVAFNVPFPPDYGGAIDIYYKLKALHEQGVAIVLHAFHYGRSPAAELDAICDEVYYYPRRSAWESFSLKYPVMMHSRRDEALLAHLQEDDAPILFEGMHTCYYLPNNALRQRKKIVRMHNLEWDYYYGLSQVETRWWKEVALRWEAAGLKSMEGILQHADIILSISPKDHAYLGTHFDRVELLTAFHGHGQVTSTTGKGDYVLYHGDLGVPENEEAVRFILSLPLEVPLIIAGRHPSPAMVAAIEKHPAVHLEANPDDATLLQLMEAAQVHLLPTFQATGIKLKLLNALYQGRHVVANSPMVAQTGLEAACAVADEPSAMAEVVHQLMAKPFTEADRTQRMKLLEPFNDEQKGRRLAALL